MAIQAVYANGATAKLADVAACCERRIAPPHQAQFARIQKLITIGATVEAALALIELELPQWKLRRLTYDAGDWHCALSKQRELPDWLDECLEASDKDLALAILAAFDAALQCAVQASHDVRPSAPQTQQPAMLFTPVLCDSFC